MLRLLALLGLLLVATATAQVLTPRLSVDLEGDLSGVAAGETIEVAARVVNEGPVAGTVQLAPSAPPGWTTTVAVARFDLAAGASREVRLTLVAPAPGEGEAEGEVGLRGTLTDAAGRTAQAEASEPVRRVDPLVAAAAPAPDRRPYALASLAIPGAVGGALLLRARRERERRSRQAAARPHLNVLGGPLPVGLRQDQIWRLEVRNPDAGPRAVRIALGDRPAGWVVALSASSFTLGPGERALLAVFAAPLDGTPVGSMARAVVEARTDGVPDAARLNLDLVVGPPRIPSGQKPAVVLRR